jgi:peroxiredoxin
MIVDDGVVRKLSVEASPGKVEASSADALLKEL